MSRSTQGMVMIANDLADAMDRLIERANASHCAVAATPSSPRGSRSVGLPSLSHSTRESGCANNAPDTNQ
jgi:hypothetical protein